MDKTECTICKVSYDVGYSYCREIECFERCAKEHPKLQTDEVAKKPKSKKRAQLKTQAADPAYSRHQGILGRSKKKNIECNITLEDIRKLIKSKCVYCGGNERIEIDRKDPLQGYTKDNTCSACRRCNVVKNNVVSYAEMLKIAEILGWKN